MNKKILMIIVIALAIGAPLAWYAISPIFRVVERNEPSPLDLQTPSAPPENTSSGAPVVQDSFNTMDEETKKRFEDETNAMREKVIPREETIPAAARLVAQGEFVAAAHDVRGKALLIQKDKELILRFEEFETINGPDLHIYLASELGVGDAIDLGSIKATKGDINYTIPAAVDTKKYTKVLVWCDPFRVLFSYAELQ